MKKVRLTREGYEKLKKELEDLKRKFMYEISERIKEARELGDLSENSEYEAAKNEQGRVGSRIMEIEQILSNAEIIEDSEESDEVTLGKWVVIKNLDTGEEHKFRIVTPQEADFFAQKLSSDSPLGKSLLGRKVGDVVKVKAPSGVQRYQVIAVMNK
ncbi:transcription elongation factor GreA [Thermotoga maritima MSB8]|jgi:transcription elongation factor GreA|uniref:Transcription elongation factor GreA n=1 Tax=Thermotoga maritima (strain ATCC 43589 / DSM 3109 / JCM 10099 / NBRC 100826 / MSB8) TaxID=243274 RepID=GREA_THEMA|nr:MULTISPECIES: transcription elongation factor GreA [Thermotoga]Q9X232.1 RecName: Full=Transcription elongation factor GreA; AltName: Full=Transcript cleavage factor GreA [Thermotoga maritima MSB8]MBZ4662316.1 Transcription elongation factor GreA [Thermotoga sp.]AAD36773.1 transcription elongation factor, greA/greB family [Thermotoga maritima MSB8]AGL50638.1 Transcription elongation factor GreA [Thermotoga maritima MSB8]AHD18399.1 transcription elongation factor GreA [Thermotoga maritima MSB